MSCIVDSTAQAWVQCSSSGGPFTAACAGTDVAVRATAEATAEAFALGWSRAVSCGECEIESETVVQQIETVVADAAVSTWAGVCASGALSYSAIDEPTSVAADVSLFVENLVDFVAGAVDSLVRIACRCWWKWLHFLQALMTMASFSAGDESASVAAYVSQFVENHLEVTARAIAAAAWYQDNGTCAAVNVACTAVVGEDDACCSTVVASFPENPEPVDALAEACALSFYCC